MAGAVVFYGSGIVYIPGLRSFIKFIDGEYRTTNAEEIKTLAIQHRHDIPDQDDTAENGEIIPDQVDKPKRGRKPNADRNT
jgi:hypothetical protein